MKLKIDSYSILIRIIGLFCIGVLLYDLISKVLPINKMLGAVILFIILYRYIRRHGRKMVCILALLLLMIYSMFRVEDYGYAFLESIYWINTILILILFSNKKEKMLICDSLQNAKNYLRGICIIGNLILLVCLLLPICYNDNWGGYFFIGYASSNHVLACGCCLLLTMALFVTKDIKNNFMSFAYFILPSYAVLQSGSRIYLLSVLVLWFTFYKYCLNNKTIKMILLPLVMICMVYIFLNSGIYAKMMNPSAYGDLVGIAKVTNGRSDFWSIDLHQFSRGSLLDIFLGGGFDYSARLNLKYYGIYIWAHNDFIEVLLSVGIVGIIIYLFATTKMVKSLFRNCEMINVIMIFGYYFGVAFMNGFFPYQHYVYSFLLLELFCFIQSDVKKEAR